jgi:putative tryptophan/tyrosine transport system substrate-binding protein
MPTAGFREPDPVGSHFVARIPKPGGSITGFTNFEPSLIGKWLEILKEVAPGVTRAAVVFNPKTAPDEGAFFLDPFEPIARSLGVDASPMPTRSRAPWPRWPASLAAA